MRKKYDGSVEAFDENWKKTKESLNIYWTKKKSCKPNRTFISNVLEAIY